MASNDHLGKYLRQGGRHKWKVLVIEALRADRRSGRAPAAALTVALVLAMPACGSGPPAKDKTPAAEGHGDAAAGRADPEAVRKEYAALQQQAMADVRAWEPTDGRSPDPRPAWADRLEKFAVAHGDSPEAADALAGVMQMRAAMFDAEGFFREYDLMLKCCPDAPGVADVFPQVSAMRMVETGGREIFVIHDLATKQRFWRRAVPLVVADMKRAIAATKNPATLAAAEYTIGVSWYQLDVDLGKALTHFKTVVEKYPDWIHAGLARELIAEIEKLGPGNPAPLFEAVGIDGRAVSLAALKGRIVLVDFWATWCEPCLRELPNLKRAYERYHHRGFTIVGVSADTDEAALVRFVTKEKMTWPIVVDDPIFNAYSVSSIPMSYLIDRQGRIRGRALYGSEVERTVGELLEQ